MKNNFDLKKFLVENKLTQNSKLINENKVLPLEVVQDMYNVAYTVDQGYEPEHDVKGAENREKEYELKYPEEYRFISSVAANDEYGGSDDKSITDEEALQAVGFTLDQIRNT